MTTTTGVGPWQSFKGWFNQPLKDAGLVGQPISSGKEALGKVVYNQGAKHLGYESVDAGMTALKEAGRPAADRLAANLAETVSTDVFKTGVKEVADDMTGIAADKFGKNSADTIAKSFIKNAKNAVLKEGAETISTEAAKETLREAGKKTLLGRLAGLGHKVLSKVGNVAKGIPILSFGIDLLSQLPEIGRGFKEGRGFSQIAHSITEAGFTTLGATALAALVVVSNPATLALAIGAGVVGAIMGKAVGNGLATGAFGKNKGKEATEAAQQIPQEQVDPNNPFAEMQAEMGLDPMMYDDQQYAMMMGY